MARGGARKGSGRKPGKARPQLRDFYTVAEMQAYVTDLKERAKTDSRLKIFEGEHLFGKAPQPLVGDPTQPFHVEISETVAKKNKIKV